MIYTHKINDKRSIFCTVKKKKIEIQQAKTTNPICYKFRDGRFKPTFFVKYIDFMSSNRVKKIKIIIDSNIVSVRIR